MGQKGDAQHCGGFVTSISEESVDEGAEGAIEVLEGKFDIGVVVELVAMANTSHVGS